MFTEEEALELEKVEITDLLMTSPERKPFGWFCCLMLRWQRSSGWRHWRRACSLILSLLFVLFCFLENPSLSLLSTVLPGTVSSAKSVQERAVLAGKQDIACLVDAALSPDQHFIAVVGYSQGCGQVEGIPAIVRLYKLASGQLIRQFSPDDAIAEALYGPVSASQTGRRGKPGAVFIPLVYTQLLWSADSKHLALTFSLPLLDPPVVGIVFLKSIQAELSVSLIQEEISSFSEGAPLTAEILLSVMNARRVCIWPGFPARKDSLSSC